MVALKEMIEVLHSGMMELEQRISKASSTFGRLHKLLGIKYSPSVNHSEMYGAKSNTLRKRNINFRQ